jgi:apolipoprotein N-acyltransferase
MRFLWLLGQFLIVIAWGAILIAVVIAIWYGFSFVVLTVVGKLFRLRGRPPRE